MFKNIKAGSFLKIPIYINLTVLLAPLLFYSMESSILANVAFIVSVYLSVLLHEFGHAYVAKKWYNYPVEKLIIHILGGGAMVDPEKMKSDPKKHLVIAIAGPVVNILLFFISIIGAVMFLPELVPDINGNTSLPLDMDTIFGFFAVNALINIMMAFFNLLPIFPMDGGRIMKCLLEMGIREKGDVIVNKTSSKLKVKMITAIVSIIFGLGLVSLGVWSGDWLLMGFGGLFVAISAHSFYQAIKGKTE